MSKDSKDALQICVAYVLERLRHHKENMNDAPFFLGANGVQGIGKSYLVSGHTLNFRVPSIFAFDFELPLLSKVSLPPSYRTFSQVASLAHELEQAPHDIRTIVLSIDDFYLTHEDQVRLAADQSDNPLVQHRGQPSTHDLSLALSVVASLRAKQETSVPSYEKSAFDGKGDRKPQTQWTNVNKNGQQPVQLVVLEGWCVGFRALDDTQLTAVWTDAVKRSTQGNSYRGRLGHNRLDNVHFINEALRGYDSLTDQLDALIHLDAEDPQYVYEWRLEQEDQLRRERGSGMTNAEVTKFVDGYYPSYELFSDRLRSGAFENRHGAQLRLVIRKDRRVKEVIKL